MLLMRLRWNVSRAQFDEKRYPQDTNLNFYVVDGGTGAWQQYYGILLLFL